MNRRLLRSRSSLGFLLAAAGCLAPGLAPGAAAQTAETTLSLPGSTVTMLSGTKGATWSQVRDGGLIYGFRGESGFYISVVSLAVKDGRVVDQWNAGTRLQARPGTTTLPGDRFLPGDEFPPGDKFKSGDTFVRGDLLVSASDARAAITSGDATVFFDPRYASRATGLLVVAVPMCSSSDRACSSSRTRPLFMQTETTLD